MERKRKKKMVREKGGDWAGEPLPH
jgi:hypothetical protein